MKNIQRAMVVLLSHSLCVQAQVTMQQNLDTFNAWHIRNSMGENTGKNNREILSLHKFKVKEIQNSLLRDTAFKKVNIDSHKLRILRNRLSEQYFAIHTGIKRTDTLHVTTRKIIFRQESNGPLSVLAAIPVCLANLSEINLDQINDHLVCHKYSYYSLSIGKEIHVGDHWACEYTTLYCLEKGTNEISESPWKLKFGLKRNLKNKL